MTPGLCECPLSLGCELLLMAAPDIVVSSSTLFSAHSFSAGQNRSKLYTAQLSEASVSDKCFSLFIILIAFLVVISRCVYSTLLLLHKWYKKGGTNCICWKLLEYIKKPWPGLSDEQARWMSEQNKRQGENYIKEEEEREEEKEMLQCSSHDVFTNWYSIDVYSLACEVRWLNKQKYKQKSESIINQSCSNPSQLLCSAASHRLTVIPAN